VSRVSHARWSVPVELPTLVTRRPPCWHVGEGIILYETKALTSTFNKNKVELFLPHVTTDILTILALLIYQNYSRLQIIGISFGFGALVLTVCRTQRCCSTASASSATPVGGGEEGTAALYTTDDQNQRTKQKKSLIIRGQFAWLQTGRRQLAQKKAWNSDTLVAGGRGEEKDSRAEKMVASQ